MPILNDRRVFKTQSVAAKTRVYPLNYLFLFQLRHTNDQSSVDAVNRVFKLLSRTAKSGLTSLKPQECRQICVIAFKCRELKKKRK